MEEIIAEALRQAKIRGWDIPRLEFEYIFREAVSEAHLRGAQEKISEIRKEIEGKRNSNYVKTAAGGISKVYLKETDIAVNSALDSLLSSKALAVDNSAAGPGVK